MKRTKICPKCNSSDIYRVEGSVGGYGSGNNISLGASIFSCVPVAQYVCCRCGYVEQWLAPQDIQKVKNSRKATHV